MENPPTYQEATNPPDWLSIVAPYMPIRCYAKLCRVSRKFNREFYPRLWNDPVSAARSVGVRPANETKWLLWFLKKHVTKVRRSTLELILSLDLRGFAKTDYAISDESDEQELANALQEVPRHLTNLRCLFLDDHEEFDPVFLLKSHAYSAAHHRAFMLSLAGCKTSIPANFFASPYMGFLMYLDVSGGKGVINATGLSARNLPALRVLKARNHNVDDKTVRILLAELEGRLWSLDLSDNKLTDESVLPLVAYCLVHKGLRSDAYFDREGKLKLPEGFGRDRYGQFMFVEESEWSSTFGHPERYFVDAPSYVKDMQRQSEETNKKTRADGRTMIPRDSPDEIKHVLAGGLGHTPPTIEDLKTEKLWVRDAILTHLHLNGNRFTTSGVECLIRCSGGHLEHFECDWTSIKTSDMHFPKTLVQSMKLYGMLGNAHMFRPVLSSNLRVLRVHHSLATQIPHIETTELCRLECRWIAETSVLEHSDLAFPEAFVPDMNPRIHTLTLTGIPRRSEKKLLEKLLHFLDLAHQQELIIRKSAVSDSRRGSNMLPGLRRLCLEFEPDVVEDEASLSLSNDFDAGKLMSDADQGFSFFEDQWEPSPEFKRWKEEGADASTLPSHDACRVKSEVTPEWTGRLTHHPFDTLPPGEEHVTHSLVWYGKDVTIPVWVGSGEMTSSKAVNLYMQYLRPSSMFDPEPASPAHVRAGVPAESYIFPHAWNAIMLPASVEKPSKRQLESMTDVIASLKTTRRRGKAIYEESLARSNGDVTKAIEASSYWTGQLTMVFAPRTPRYSTAHPWR